MKNEKTRIRSVSRRLAAPRPALNRASSASKLQSIWALPTGDATADTAIPAALRRRPARSISSGARSTTLTPHAERSSSAPTPCSFNTAICSSSPGAISSPNALMGQRSATFRLLCESPVRFTQNQVRLEHQLLPLVRAHVRGQEQASGDLAELAGRLLDHGQGAPDQRSPRRIAKASDRNVPGPAHPPRTQGPEHARGKDHAAAEDRVRPWRERQQIERALPSVVTAERPQPNGLLVEAETRLLESGSGSLQPFASSPDALEPPHQLAAPLAPLRPQPSLPLTASPVL